MGSWNDLKKRRILAFDPRMKERLLLAPFAAECLGFVS